MFTRESEMLVSVARWMKAGGMTVKSEFVTPWGICDLVGLRFNRKNVARRLRFRQTRGINSITRALLLLRIPDVDERKSITLRTLIRNCRRALSEEIVRKETSRLISDRFVVRAEGDRLQKVNGWMPLQERLVAVEMKLSRIDEVMRQAVNNLAFADESYVAMPSDVAHRVASKPERWPNLSNAGIGLLSVTRRGCEVLLPASSRGTFRDPAIQLYCAEKFWRTRSKGS